MLARVVNVYHTLKLYENKWFNFDSDTVYSSYI